MKLALVSICSEQYLPQYRVLFHSVKKVNPFTKQILYQVSGLTPEWVDEVVNCSEMLATVSHYPLHAQICAIRPTIVLDTFARGYDVVGHLGADVEFFSDFTLDVFGLGYDVLVTPHITSPLPEDGKNPTNEGVAKTGHINSDVVFFRNTPQVVQFLKWQEQVQKTKCIQSSDIFLDQTWLNFLPAFVDNVFWLRHPGWNVAYWNVKERGLVKVGERYKMSTGEPLVCYQYSGLPFHEPKQLSVHQNRHRLEDGSVELELLQSYVERVNNGKN